MNNTNQETALSERLDNLEHQVKNQERIIKSQNRMIQWLLNSVSCTEIYLSKCNKVPLTDKEMAILANHQATMELLASSSDNSAIKQP